VAAATGGRLLTRAVRDPLGRPVRAAFGLTGDRRTAVIEMARASGLVLLKSSERNPLVTSTFGTGELICLALDLRVRKILVGIGGSATNDGGTGMARALGVRFLDRRGRPLPEGGGALAKLDRIDLTRLDPRVRNVTFEVACDVTNPLTGPNGAAAVYGPQKGATPEMVATLDKGLSNLASCIKRDLHKDVEALEGAGAAGGLGAGLVAFLGATLARGVDIVTNAVGLPAKLRGADLVLTGEGRIDAQSAFGKAVCGVAAAAKAAGVPCIVLAGSVGDGADALFARGVTAVFSIARGPASEKDMMSNAEHLLEAAACQVVRAFSAGLAAKGGSR
jgi:glycerate kinase